MQDSDGPQTLAPRIPATPNSRNDAVVPTRRETLVGLRSSPGPDDSDVRRGNTFRNRKTDPRVVRRRVAAIGLDFVHARRGATRDAQLDPRVVSDGGSTGRGA